MKGVVQVHVAASPPLFDELVRRSLVGDGVDLTDSSDCLVTVVTSDHLGEAHSRVVLVLGSSTGGDVEVIIDEQHSEPSPLRCEQLRDFVIDVSRGLCPPEPAQG